MITRGVDAVQRDLGLLDTHERKQLDELMVWEEGSTRNRLFFYVFSCLRRDGTNRQTLDNIRRLSPMKQVQMKWLYILSKILWTK